MWQPRFACPLCKAPLDEPQALDASTCAGCGERFERRGGVLHLLAAPSARAAQAFAIQNQAVRARDGSPPLRPQDYRMLPCVPSEHPQAAAWKIRRASYTRLQRYLPDVWRDTLRIADLGAGCGWLSHRLTALGHRVVAVDWLDDEVDGLGACRHYPVSFPAVRGDFDALPFAPAQFDLTVFNASLHCSADIAATLTEALTILAPGGTVVVMDSPMFVDPDDGRRMMANQLLQRETEAGITSPTSTGVGFLTFEKLASIASDLGLDWHYVPSRGSMLWQFRHQIAGIRFRRVPATFGMWMAR